MNFLHGFALTLLGGVTVGFSSWSLKWARIWKFENYWLLHSIIGLTILPFCLAYYLLPHLVNVYASLSAREFVKPFLFGFLWGFALLGAGVCMHRLGFAVTGGVINGTGAAVGTLAPLILLHRAMMFETIGLLILVGTMVMLIGVALCMWSGYHREEEAKRQGRGAGFSPKESAMHQKAYSRLSYLLFVAVAFGAGLLSALLNLALAYGGNIMEKVRAAGGAASWAPFAVWPIAFLGGSIVNIAFCVYLLSKNHTWGKFAQGIREVFNPLLAACMLMAGIAFFSSGTTFLGILGVSVGFALYTITVVLCGQFTAIITGEWSRMPSSIYRFFAAGIACLSVAVLVIGASNYFGK
jgi:L-rhamnose-H+ transport protein